MRAAASREGLRICRSRQTAVRKRTASAITPVSASANAYSTTRHVVCLGRLNTLAGTVEQSTLPYIHLPLIQVRVTMIVTLWLPEIVNPG